MLIRLLIVTPDGESRQLLGSLVESALDLVCFDVETADVASQEEMFGRIEQGLDDVVLLDWSIVEADTPDLVRTILIRNPQLRVVVLLPSRYKQYRQLVWDAGACSSIPKEHMEQEWLSSVLCVMHRAMEREARLQTATVTRSVSEIP